MTYEQYWYGDVWLVEAFLKADKVRQERMNAEAWLQGVYFYDAISTALHNFSRKKGEKPKEYASEPYDIGKKKREKSEAEKQKEAERERTRLVAHLNRIAAARREQQKGG